jgi:hypothetical protein
MWSLRARPRGGHMVTFACPHTTSPSPLRAHPARRNKPVTSASESWSRCSYHHSPDRKQPSFVRFPTWRAFPSHRPRRRPAGNGPGRPRAARHQRPRCGSSGRRRHGTRRATALPPGGRPPPARPSPAASVASGRHAVPGLPERSGRPGPRVAVRAGCGRASPW